MSKFSPASAISNTVAPIAAGPAIIGVASEKITISSIDSASRRSSCKIEVPPLDLAKIISSPNKKSIVTLAARRAAKDIPKTFKTYSPNSVKNMSISADMAVPRMAIDFLSFRLNFDVSARKLTKHLLDQSS